METNTEKPDFFDEWLVLRQIIERGKRTGEIPAALADSILTQAHRLREAYDDETWRIVLDSVATNVP